MIDDEDYDDGGPIGHFKSAKDILRDRLNSLSKKPAHSLTDAELFLCVREGLCLASTIPEALKRLEVRRLLDVYRELGDEALQIVGRNQAYFRTHPEESRRYELLIKRIAYAEDFRTGAYKTCRECSAASGSPKRLYVDQESAQYAAERSSQYVDHGLRVYRCEHKNGWHLTKS